MFWYFLLFYKNRNNFSYFRYYFWYICKTVWKSINAHPVQRNSGIDGFLKTHVQGKPVPVKIQGNEETLDDAIEKLERACKRKGYALKIVIQTKKDNGQARLFGLKSDVEVVKSSALLIEEKKERIKM